MYEIQEHSKVTNIFDTDFRSEMEAQIALRKKENWESAQAMLACLMAAENLRVVFDANMKAPAHIDLRRRIVRIARLVSGQQHLIKGLLVHEIGHARYTKGNEPVDHVLNIVEDGYIERMISKKYPGGKKHLKVVFDHFFSEEFVKEYCGEKMNLLTRTLNIMNYNCKGIKFGKRIPYPTELPAEMIKFFEQEVEMCILPTLTERDAIAKKVKKLLKEFREPALEPMNLPNLGDIRPECEDDETDGGGEGGGIDWGDDDEDSEPEEKPTEVQAPKEKEEDYTDQDENGYGNPDLPEDEPKKEETPEEASEEGEGEGENDSSPAKASGEKDEEEEAEKDTPANTSGAGGSGVADDNDDQEIEEWWKANVIENKDELFDHHEGFETEGQENKTGRVSLEIATPDAVFDMARKKDITEIPALKEVLYDQDLTRAERAYSKDLEEAKYTARAMYQKFLLEQNASEAQRVTHQKTGSLDIARLSQYKINNNIFKTRRVLPEGVNHGAVMVLDWSGSMNSKIKDLWFRAAEFVEFAHLSGVEVVIWAFTTTHSGSLDAEPIQKNPDFMINHGQFFRIVDTVNHSRMENVERIRRFWTLVQLKTGMKMGWRSSLRSRADRSGFGMGGTNILEAQAFAHYLARGLKTDRKNILVVSDGSDNSSWSENTVPDGGIFNPDDPHNPTPVGGNGWSSGRPQINPRLDGRSLQEISPAGEHHNWKPREEALYRQIEKSNQEGVSTTGIYIGLPARSKMESLMTCYREKFVVWPNWNGKGGKRQRVKDNAFISQLVKMISS